jgi:MFS family permease
LINQILLVALVCLGFACGPALAGVIGDHYGLSAPFFLCGAGMSLAAGSALVFLPETMRRADVKVKRDPQQVVLQAGTTAAVNEEITTAEATKDQAVWQKWSKLLKVPNLQAVYVRNTLA